MPSRIRVLTVATIVAVVLLSAPRAGMASGFTSTACAARCTATAARSWPVPKHWHAPRPWLYQAWCLHDGLRRDDRGHVLYRVRNARGQLLSGEGAWNAATGNGYEGGLQFLASTWTRAGGSIDSHGHWASVTTPREQLYRAWIIWRSHGGSWSEWGEMRPACGLR